MTNIIATLPKVDLCRDFSCSVSPGFARQVLGKKGNKLTSWRGFDSVESYRASLRKARQMLSKADDFERAAVHVLEDLVERSVVHAEFHLDPLVSKVPITEQLERIDAGHEIVTEEHEEALVSYGYIIELDREADPAKLTEALDAAMEASDRVLAVAFVGKEIALSPGHVALLQKARESGLRVVMSAGLTPGSKPLIEAAEAKADRVLHGFSVLKKEKLLTQLRATRTPFVCTPTIEVQGGRAKSYAKHPIRKMLDAGLFCTFASGAPLLISGSLTSEYDHLSVHLNWRLDALRNSTLRAVEAGFIDPKLRFVVARAVENWRHRPRLTAGGEDDSFGM